MSAYQCSRGLGVLSRPQMGAGQRQRIEGVRRNVVGALASSIRPGCGEYRSQPGLAHMFGVYLLELDEMARGAGKGSKPEAGSGMPRFVDVKLSTDQREAFKQWTPTGEELWSLLQQTVFEGYRVGCSWSGEHQSFTVSLTGREGTGSNQGLCVTSFAKDLYRAVALAMFKHYTVCEGVWSSGGVTDDEDFG